MKNIISIRVITRKKVYDVAELGILEDSPRDYPILHKMTWNNKRLWFNAINVNCMQEAHDNYDKFLYCIKNNKRYEAFEMEAVAHIMINGVAQEINNGIVQFPALDISYSSLVKKNEVEELLKTLEELGFSDNEITKAPIYFDNNEQEES